MSSDLSNLGAVSAAQGNGEMPTVLASGSAPGESGVSVCHFAFHGGAHFKAQLKQHMITFVSKSRIHCRAADRYLSHDAPGGSLHTGPAGIDGSADSDNDIESIVILVKPERLSLAAADHGALDAQLVDSLVGHDPVLLELARTLTRQTRDGYPDGTIFWNETAARFIDALAANHTRGRKTADGGVLDVAALDKIRDFILAHLDRPLDVEMLAKIANRSQFHFSRAFSRAVGVSPYRYVTGLRVQRAMELVRNTHLSLAEVATRTGFADQSHLSRWVRRVKGVTLTELRR